MFVDSFRLPRADRVSLISVPRNSNLAVGDLRAAIVIVRLHDVMYLSYQAAAFGSTRLTLDTLPAGTRPLLTPVDLVLARMTDWRLSAPMWVKKLLVASCMPCEFVSNILLQPCDNSPCVIRPGHPSCALKCGRNA